MPGTRSARGAADTCTPRRDGTWERIVDVAEGGTLRLLVIDQTIAVAGFLPPPPAPGT